MTQHKELPGSTPGRAAKIAAIHSLAQWFADHPEAPMPNSIEAYHTINSFGELDEATRVAVVMSAARRLDIQPREGDSTVRASLNVADPDVHGIRIQYMVVAVKDAVAPKKYL